MTPAVAQQTTPEAKILLRVMSVSALSAAASGGASAVASKIIAVMLGPAALAVLSTLQQIRQAALTAATANGQTALIQGASALTGESRRDYLRTVALIFAAGSAVSGAALALAPAVIARWTGLPTELANLIRPLALVVALSSVFGFLTALLNAQGATGGWALAQFAGPAAMALAAWPVARLGMAAVRWFPAMLAFSALAAAGTAWAALRPGPFRRGRLGIWSEGARRFFSISGVMLATGLAGSAALLAVRAGILRGEGLAVAGRFDAAWNISMNQATLLLASLQTYYLPTLARLPDPERRAQHIGQVLRLAAPASAGAIALIALAKPWLFTLLYSGEFAGASQYLRWTLLGDYLKVASWILSVPMLASAHMRIFAFADLAAAAAFVSTAALLAPWRQPAESAAIAFVAMQALHLGISAVYVRRWHAFRWGARTAGVWLGGLALAAAASAWSWNF